MEIFSRLFVSSSSSCCNGFSSTQKVEVPMAKKRLEKEMLITTRDPPSHCSGGPVGKNIFNWRGAIVGPSESPFEGGVFYVSVRIPDDYPYRPPKIKFETKVYHPNIDSDGNINVDILKHNWTPALTIPNLLLSICSFLVDPNPEDPRNPIANIYRNDPKQYNKMARAWTRKYAM